jgi:hypothetical protein
MPQHSHPFFRAWERAKETVGAIITLDSVGYTVVKAQETANILPAPVLPLGKFIFEGQSITPSS